MKKNKVPKIKSSSNDKVFDISLIIIAIIGIIVVAYPLYFIIIASISDPSAVASGQTLLLPKNITFDGYKELFKTPQIWVGYRNTIIYTVLGTFIGLAVNIPVGYALSRKDLVGRKLLTWFYMITMFFSGGLIPTFLTVKELGFYDNFWVMVLPFSVSVYNIIVAKSFFQSNLPEELWEAAKIDGCSNIRYFIQIVLPLSKAIIAVIGLWTAVGMWNSYFNALIYLRDESLYPLQLILRNILITNQMQSAMGTGEAAQIAIRNANLMRYAVIIISTAPIMCVYPFVQKHFNKGIMVGSIKG
ncbi:MAG: carbohydrate ABC transporter permease [Clostridium sp.]|uniref:carbohydrate ABC transporter permease n=1 Tax=Clostridium sp. TaxID=1506 RepID=UPI0025C4409F|nr:carbohydrate ABC transporter permease [Clostridium sp.]MCF0147963.1 carbohydrate ABC transporter permease [Clostridium sp.]